MEKEILKPFVNQDETPETPEETPEEPEGESSEE